MTRSAAMTYLDARRRKKRLSVLGLSRLTGIRRQVVHRYLAGQAHPPIDRVELMAHAMGLELTVRIRR